MRHSRLCYSIGYIGCVPAFVFRFERLGDKVIPLRLRLLSLASSEAFAAAFVTVKVYVFVASKFAAVTFAVMTFAPTLKVYGVAS